MACSGRSCPQHGANDYSESSSEKNVKPRPGTSIPLNEAICATPDITTRGGSLASFSRDTSAGAAGTPRAPCRGRILPALPSQGGFYAARLGYEQHTADLLTTYGPSTNRIRPAPSTIAWPDHRPRDSPYMRRRSVSELMKISRQIPAMVPP